MRGHLKSRTTLDGQSREFGESGQTLAIIFALALIVIYLVLAAQFESFVAPFIILFAAPLAATSATFGTTQPVAPLAQE